MPSMRRLYNPLNKIHKKNSASSSCYFDFLLQEKISSSFSEARPDEAKVASLLREIELIENPDLPISEATSQFSVDERRENLLFYDFLSCSIYWFDIKTGHFKKQLKPSIQERFH